jgi:hypothetical protein
LDYELTLAVVAMCLFHSAGQAEARSGGEAHGILWALLSALVSAAVLIGLEGTWSLLLFCQLGLFVAIGVVRGARQP